MSDAMNNPYANNPNQNGSNEQQPQGQPEYGAYAPNQQSQSQQQGGNPNNSGNPYQSEPQTPCYFDGPNANPNPNQNGFFYASYTTGQPYGQPYGQQNWVHVWKGTASERTLCPKIGQQNFAVTPVTRKISATIWPQSTLKYSTA